jgi:hypothetical protein
VSRRHRRHRRLAAVLVTAVCVLVGGALPAVAQDITAESLGLEVVAGFDGNVVPGTWTPVAVRVQPDRPFSGRVLVAAGTSNGRVLLVRDLEAGAGVTKVVRVLAPPATSLQVQVVATGADQAVTVRPRANRADGFLVGLLGSIDPAAAPPVTSAVTGQRAQYTTITADLLDLGPRALSPLGTLVAPATELAALPQAARRTIEAAVAAGLQLVVTGTTGPEVGVLWSPVATLTPAGFDRAPSAWVTSVADLVPDLDGAATTADIAAIRAGRGRVVATTFALDAGPADGRLWEALLQPSAPPPALASSDGFTRVTEQLPEALRATTGDLPSVGLLALFLVVYVVVVGPVTALVLSRRRRRELAWVVVPAITAVFATAAFFGATGGRPQAGVAGRAAFWSGDIGTTVAIAGVRSPQAGTHTIDLPGAGWDVVGVGWGSDAQVRGGPDRTGVRLLLQPQEFGAIVGWQQNDAPAPLAVEAAILNGELRLEITNRTTADLTDVAVLAATHHETLSDVLAAGETLVRTVPLPAVLPVDNDPFMGPFVPWRPEGDDGPAPLSSVLRWDVLAGHPGMVWVTGNHAGDLGLGTPVVDGTRPFDRGTFVAVGTTPTATDDATSPFEVQRDLLVRGVRDVWQDGPLSIGGLDEAVLRFRLPREGTPTALALALDRGGLPGGGFVEEPMPRPECPPDAISCTFDGTSMEVCFADGHCEGWAAAMPAPAPPVPDLPGGAVGLQLWDRLERRWVEADGDVLSGTTTEIDRFLNPLGELYVRAVGGLFPFDTSGRSVGATVAPAGEVTG